MTEYPNKLWLERNASEFLDSEELQRSLGVSRITVEALLRRDLNSS